MLRELSFLKKDHMGIKSSPSQTAFSAGLHVVSQIRTCLQMLTTQIALSCCEISKVLYKEMRCLP